MSVVSRVSDVRSRSARRALVASIVGLVMLAAAPGTSAAGEVTLTTPFPAIAVAPGLGAQLRDLGHDRRSPAVSPSRSARCPPAGRRSCAAAASPSTASNPTARTPTKVTLDVTVPADAAEGTQRIDRRAARSTGASTTLPVDIRVTPNAAGDVTLTTDIPQLKGASDATFPFTLTLTNDTPEDLPFSVAASGPPGWTVTAQVGSQAQAASVVVKAGSTSPVTVSAKAAEGTAAGAYPITVDATSGSQTAHADLAVEITGSYKLALTTADQRLNLSATAGLVSDLTLTLTEHRDGRRRGVAMCATAPTGWKVEFDPPTVTVPAGQSVQVVAHVTPSADAIAGDYVTTFKATAPVANARADVRVTIETSLLWGVGRHRVDRPRADRPVVDVPPVRPPMSGVGAPPVAPPVEPREGRRASRRTGRPEPVIRTRRLTKTYGTLTAVDRLDLEVYPGEIFGLLGQNGAGKTTTILMLLGLSEPTDGEASVMGLDPAREPREVKRRVGYLPDAVGFYGEHDRPPEPALHGPPQRPPTGRGRGRDRRRSSSRSAWPTAPTTRSTPIRAACASGSASPMRWSSRPTC